MPIWIGSDPWHKYVVHSKSKNITSIHLAVSRLHDTYNVNRDCTGVTTVNTCVFKTVNKCNWCVKVWQHIDLLQQEVITVCDCGLTRQLDDRAALIQWRGWRCVLVVIWLVLPHNRDVSYQLLASWLSVWSGPMGQSLSHPTTSKLSKQCSGNTC